MEKVTEIISVEWIEEVIPYISSANIACGFHASDPMVMAKTVALAKSRMYVSARILAIQTDGVWKA